MSGQSEFANIGIQRSADFSPCGTYRYTLKRTWDDSLPSLLCVLLNPSTADAEHDDPTNTKVMRWAMRNGYGRLTFCNLFAYRSPYPEFMKRYPEPIGPANNSVIARELRLHDMVVAGWGNDGDHMGRDRVVISMWRIWHCFRINDATLQPMHPLYMPGDTKLSIYNNVPERAS